MAPALASGRVPSLKMASCLSFLKSCWRKCRRPLPLVKMAPARAARPGLGARPVGFTARASVTPPHFRRKKRRERWQRLRFEFQRRRRSPNETWVGGGGDLGNRAGSDRGRGWGGKAVATPPDINATTSSVSMMDSVLEEDVTLPGIRSGCRCGPAFGGSR